MRGTRVKALRENAIKFYNKMDWAWKLMVPFKSYFRRVKKNYVQHH